MTQSIRSNSRVTFVTDAFNGDANYLNVNHQIKMPIFSIHGNHDSPIGLDLLSSLDQLSENSYVNYFGKVPDIQSTTVEPVVLSKGSTKIAIYGIGWINDSRLNLLLRRGQIRFLRPLTEDEKIDENVFNILVMHQNRYKGMHEFSTDGSISDDQIPDFIDFVVWGHEHECQTEIRKNANGTHIL